MIFKINDALGRIEVKRARLCGKKKWFAWRPVRISPHEVAWLEYVCRQGFERWSTGRIVYHFTYRQLKELGE